MPKQQPTEQEDYFVALQQPKDVRRSILESSRRVIFALQDFHKIIMLREKKQALFEQLQGEMKEVTVLINKMNKYFPENKLSQLKARKPTPKPMPRPQIKQPAKQQVKQPKPQPKQRSELDDLSDMLSNIEEKLQRMQ